MIQFFRAARFVPMGTKKLCRAPSATARSGWHTAPLALIIAVPACTATFAASILVRMPPRDKWLAAQPAFASMSALVFFNLGGVLGEFGWRTPFWVYGSALVMFALVWLFTWEPEKAQEDAAPGQAPPGAQVHVGETAHDVDGAVGQDNSCLCCVLNGVFGLPLFP